MIKNDQIQICILQKKTLFIANEIANTNSLQVRSEEKS